MNEIEKALWQEDSASGVSEQGHLLEQYKLYVELTDRISQRRGTTNTLFLLVNTAVVTAMVTFHGHIPGEIAVALYLAAATTTITWALLLRSYRNLNTAKFQVIGALEKRLPAQMFHAAEWQALGEGKDYKKYIPLSLIETAAPVIYFLIYSYLILRT